MVPFGEAVFTSQLSQRSTGFVRLQNLDGLLFVRKIGFSSSWTSHRSIIWENPSEFLAPILGGNVRMNHGLTLVFCAQKKKVFLVGSGPLYRTIEVGKESVIASSSRYRAKQMLEIDESTSWSTHVGEKSSMILSTRMRRSSASLLHHNVDNRP